MTKNLSYAAFSSLLVVVVCYNSCAPFDASNSNQTSGNSIFANKVCNKTTGTIEGLRRLSREEYRYSVQDLFGISTDPTESFPINQSGTDNFTSIAAVQSMSVERTNAFLVAAEKTVESAFAVKSPILQCSPGQQNITLCSQEIIQKVATRAWRRPIGTDEFNALKEVHSKAMTLVNSQSNYVGNKEQDGLRIALQAILMSPRFLFMVNDLDESGQMDPYSLATRLSYFLWSSIPDQELLDLANSKALITKSVMRDQISRMLKDKKASRFAKEFSNQWLSLSSLQSSIQVSVDGLTDDLRQSLRTETELFFEEIVREDSSPTEIMEGNFSFINETLAQHYKISGVTGADFLRVNTKSLNRRGLLNQGSILTLTSGAKNTKPTGRGNFILNRVMCSPPPAFPDGGVVTPLQIDDEGLTIKEKLAIHRSKPSCIGCHSMMDPVGLGLEKFNQLGQFRAMYPEIMKPVDASGVLLNQPFNDHHDLISIIVDKGSFGRCFSSKVLSYASGRTITKSADDQCMVNEIATSAVQRSKTFTDFVMAVVTSESFLQDK